jgi:dipeptidyl-peptidase-3
VRAIARRFGCRALAAALGCSVAAAAVAAAPAATVGVAGKARVLGKVGYVTVASYPPTGFDRLSVRQRVLAYHLVAAALAGDAIFTMQTSRYSLPALKLVRAILAKADRLDPGVRDRLRDYHRMLFIHHGLHDKWRSNKLEPPLSRRELEVAARAAGVETSPDLLAAMFDPKVLPLLIDKTPGAGRDAIAVSAPTHYQGLSSKDLEGYQETFLLNGRLVKRDGKILEEVYRAGDGTTAPGLGAAELAEVIVHLEAAMALAPPVQRQTLATLVKYFRSGDNDLFRQHDILWLAHIFPVDYILGFVEQYTDVRQRKGAFLGFVAIPDPEHDPPQKALARNAAYFERKLPYDPRFKRRVFRPPAAAAVSVLAATGDGGPLTFGGANLPNLQELREHYGTKNFITASVVDAHLQLQGTALLDELAPEEVRAELRRCQASFPYAFIGFHEVIGHGSGRVSPSLEKRDPSELLAPYFLTLEEGRADLVADYLAGDPRTVSIGLLDAGCVGVYPAARTLLLVRNYLEVPAGDHIEEDHLRAGFIELAVLRERGALAVEVRGGKSFFVVKDPVLWRRVVGELLAEYQRMKATGDRAALAALVEKYGTRLDPALRDEIVARQKKLDVPEVIATIPPLLTPIRDAAGRVVDARAEQVTSVDAYIAAVEEAAISKM